ncbi:MAG: 30S ribosomal protein S20 [Clostridia bacterium]|nr:30S ribosomal protein S20 [Clostridia bacterium]
MPNIKSAIKRVEIAKQNRLRNKSEKSKIATFIKKFKKAIAEKDLENAETLYKTVVGLMDSAAIDNVIHKNSASRKSAHFAKILDNAKKQK